MIPSSSTLDVATRGRRAPRLRLRTGLWLFALAGGLAAAASPALAQPSASEADEARPVVSAQGRTLPAPPVTDPTRGIVRLERGGRLIGYGSVLGRDGRILTALSALGHGNQIEARFADDRVSTVRVVASDRGSDLALLESQSVIWTDGLKPSSLEPAADGVVLRRFRARGKRLEESAAPVDRRLALSGRDGAVIDGALMLGGRFSDSELGTPIFDAAGQVVGVVAMACAPKPVEHCKLAPYAAPIAALKAFLRSAPRCAPEPVTWLGVQGVAGYEGSVSGVQVLSVEPRSAAAAAGLSPAGSANPDLIVAVNGSPVVTWDEFRDAINRIALSDAPAVPAAAPERSARLLVYGSGRFRQLDVQLRSPQKIPSNDRKPAGTASPQPSSSTGGTHRGSVTVSAHKASATAAAGATVDSTAGGQPPRHPPGVEQRN